MSITTTCAWSPVMARRSATGVNQALVLPTEFQDIQRHYPIFFRRTDTGGFKSIALFGFSMPTKTCFLTAIAGTPPMSPPCIASRRS